MELFTWFEIIKCRKKKNFPELQSIPSPMGRGPGSQADQGGDGGWALGTQLSDFLDQWALGLGLLPGVPWEVPWGLQCRSW